MLRIRKLLLPSIDVYLWHLYDVYCFSMHLNVMWTVFIDGSVTRYGPCPSPLLAGELHYACAYIQSVITLCVCVFV